MGKETNAKGSAMGAVEKLYNWMDTFHNVEPERHPSRTGCFLTFLMIPVMLTYTIVWFVQQMQKPPLETLVIDWSVSYGPYPMKVSCHEGATCWMYLSGCESGSSGRCIALTSGQEMELEMCYSLGAREGLHFWWTGGSSTTGAGMSIYSQAKTMWMSQEIEAGRSSMTYVKTEDTTKESDHWERQRHEWFVMYLSSEALAPQHTGCQDHRSGASAAQIVMKPEFYEKKIEVLDFYLAFIGEVGGAYGVVSTIFFAMYILLWNLEYANNHRHDASASLPGPASMESVKPDAMDATASSTPKAVEVTPTPRSTRIPETADDIVMETTKEAMV